MTNLELVLLNVLTLGGFATGLYFLLRKEMRKLAADTRYQVELTYSSLKDHIYSATNVISTTIQAKMEKEQKAAKNEVIHYLDDYRADLQQKAESLKAHALELIDKTHQQQQVATLRRVICPLCNRTVVRFQTNPDNSIKGCLDCLGKQ